MAVHCPENTGERGLLRPKPVRHVYMLDIVKVPSKSSHLKFLLRPKPDHLTLHKLLSRGPDVSVD